MSQIRFTYRGTTYTLEYTRRTVKMLEDQGFVLEDVGTKIMTMLPLLFRGAFYAHHRNLKPDLVDEIFDNMTNKDGLMSKLAEMYAEPYNNLLSEPEEGAEGKVEWTAM